MNQLKKLLVFVGKRWRQILLILLVVTLILGAIARILVPPVVVVNPPKLRVTEQLAGAVELTFTGNRSLPDRLPLYRGSSLLPPHQLVETLATRLNLSPHPQVTKLYTNPDLTITLTQPDGSDLAEYGADAFSEEVPTLQEVRNLGQAFLEQAGYNFSELELREDLIKYYRASGDERTEETEPENATSIELSYIRKLGDYPVAFDSTPTNLLTLVVTKRGVSSASLPSFFFIAEQAQTVSLLSIEEVLGQIRSGNFLILGTIDVIDPKEPNNALVSLRLVTKEVEYRFDPTQELFIPFVQFIGTAKLKNGRTVEIAITTPGIETVPAL